jgi:hypothetical protein
VGGAATRDAPLERLEQPGNLIRWDDFTLM